MQLILISRLDWLVKMKCQLWNLNLLSHTSTINFCILNVQNQFVNCGYNFFPKWKQSSIIFYPISKLPLFSITDYLPTFDLLNNFQIWDSWASQTLHALIYLHINVQCKFECLLWQGELRSTYMLFLIGFGIDVERTRVIFFIGDIILFYQTEVRNFNSLQLPLKSYVLWTVCYPWNRRHRSSTMFQAVRLIFLADCALCSSLASVSKLNELTLYLNLRWN